MIINPSASDEATGKDEYRRNLVSGQSARLLCGYIYASTGNGESTRDGSIQRIAVIHGSQGPGLQHWAKLQKLKEGAKTLNYLAEHGIDSYEALDRRLAELNASVDDSLASIKAVESRIAELNLIAKYAATYRKCRPIYNRYRKSDDKEKFLRGHESEIILFEAAARELKRLGAVPLPAAEKLEAELSELTFCSRRSRALRKN